MTAGIRQMVGGTRRAMRANLDFAGPLAALGVLNTIGTVGAPLLWSVPLILIACSPRLPFLAVAAAHTGLVLFLVVATVRLCVADPFNYVMGRRHGSKAVGGVMARISWRPRRIPGWLRAAARPDHRVHHLLCAAMVLLRPNARVMAWAGAVVLPVRQTVVLDVVGTAAYVWLLHLGIGVLA